jgi:hypothetical protein
LEDLPVRRYLQMLQNRVALCYTGAT